MKNFLKTLNNIQQATLCDNKEKKKKKSCKTDNTKTNKYMETKRNKGSSIKVP